MPGFREYFGRLKVGKAGKANATEETATEETAPPGPTKSGLYSTEGSIGMRVVAEPAAAVLEYVPSLRL